MCWFFGKKVHDGLGGQVPIGLISDNWGGTPVEAWSTAASLNSCGEANKPGTAPGALYNAMIHPFTVGPMAVTGFTWYQGEANTHAGQVEEYACRFPAMITAWRQAFKVRPSTSMTHPLRVQFFVNSRTLMGCTDPLRRTVGSGSTPSVSSRFVNRLPTTHVC